MNSTEAMRVELLSLQAKADSIRALMGNYADPHPLAMELAITLGQLDRLRVIAHAPTKPTQRQRDPQDGLAGNP